MALTCGSPVSGTAPAGGAGLLLLRLVVGMPPERLAAEDLKRLVTDQFSLAVVVCRDDYFGGALGRFAQRRERRRRAPVDDPGEVRPLDHVAEVLETPPPVGIGEDGLHDVAIGLRGHVMQTVFPNTYRRWSLKYLGDMIERPDLAWVVDGSAATTLSALRKAAKGATEVVIATDYDREGELIGHEALQILRGEALRRHPDDKPEKKKAGPAGRGKAAAAPSAGAVPETGDPHVKAMLPAAVVDRHVRVHYSALTREEVEAAFTKPFTVDFNLAEAAHSRQDIDLIWGAVLTRFMSLAAYRYGSDYLSVGRVQSPTLRLVVDRELERRKVAPPAPFNTTPLMSPASGGGPSPAPAMRAAESLYLDGLISYPRTDNTVYPVSYTHLTLPTNREV